MTATAIPRPAQHDADVEARHMVMIRPQVEKYLRSESCAPDLDDAMEEVRRAMQYASDGFQIADSLSSRGWHADEELVELMGWLARQRSDARRELEAKWVRENRVKPALAVGATVTVLSGAGPHNGCVGEVTAIDEVYGRYTVLVPTLGHVRSGIGTHGFVVNYEDAVAVETAPPLRPREG